MMRCVNLRNGPGASFDVIGLVESSSKVRVAKVESNWCLVRVLVHARPKADPIQQITVGYQIDIIFTQPVNEIRPVTVKLRNQR